MKLICVRVSLDGGERAKRKSVPGLHRMGLWVMKGSCAGVDSEQRE